MEEVNYTNEEFVRLIDEVEAQGGAHLHEEMCSFRSYSFSGPVNAGKTVMIPGCGTVTTFEIPYDSGDEVRPITLCAVCDGVGYMPRFEKSVRGRR